MQNLKAKLIKLINKRTFPKSDTKKMLASVEKMTEPEIKKVLSKYESSRSKRTYNAKSFRPSRTY